MISVARRDEVIEPKSCRVAAAPPISTWRAGRPLELRCLGDQLRADGVLLRARRVLGGNHHELGRRPAVLEVAHERCGLALVGGRLLHCRGHAAAGLQRVAQLVDLVVRCRRRARQLPAEAPRAIRPGGRCPARGGRSGGCRARARARGGLAPECSRLVPRSRRDPPRSRRWAPLWRRSRPRSSREAVAGASRAAVELGGSGLQAAEAMVELAKTVFEGGRSGGSPLEPAPALPKGGDQCRGSPAPRSCR